MSKKGVVIATAVAAAMMLAGCSQQPQPIPQNQATQSGPNGKLGKMGGSSCKGQACKGHQCKGHHHCKSNHCNGYNN